MDDVTKSAYAEWLEELIQNIMEHQPEKIGVCILLPGRSARHRKTHAGKGGRVRLPSDNLSKKELQKTNGDCKSYRLNEPMKWDEFKSMPDDIKITYIKLLRQKFNVPVTYIAKMMGVTESCVRMELKKFGLTEGKGSRTGRTKWDKEGFLAWVNGVDELPTPVPEEPIEEPVNVAMGVGYIGNPEAYPEGYVEDDLPFEEPYPVKIDPIEKCIALDAENEILKIRIEELEKKLECDGQALHKWRTACIEYEEKVKILEAQMDVVRMIFGGKNHG